MWFPALISQDYLAGIRLAWVFIRLWILFVHGLSSKRIKLRPKTTFNDEDYFILFHARLVEGRLVPENNPLGMRKKNKHERTLDTNSPYHKTKLKK